MGDLGRRRVRDHFTLPVFGARLEGFIEEMGEPSSSGSGAMLTILGVLLVALLLLLLLWY